MSREKHFYQNGIRFECQGDGKCCVSRGEYGYVYLSFNDRKRIAARLGMSTDDFTEKFTQKVDGLYELRYRGNDCPFLNGRQCSIYDARPKQCRTWPFWLENMNDEVWHRDVASWCPGVGRGRLYTAEEIHEILCRKKDVS